MTVPPLRDPALEQMKQEIISVVVGHLAVLDARLAGVEQASPVPQETSNPAPSEPPPLTISHGSTAPVPGVAAAVLSEAELMEELRIDFKDVPGSEWVIHTLDAALRAGHPDGVPPVTYSETIKNWEDGVRVPVPSVAAKSVLLDACGGDKGAARDMWQATVPLASQGADTISAQNTARMCIKAASQKLGEAGASERSLSNE